MIIICDHCHKTFDISDPPGYEEMDIIEKFNVWKESENYLCPECVRHLLAKKPNTLAQ